MIFGYQRFLENENRQLKKRIEALELRYHEMVLAYGNRNPFPEAAKVTPKHTMSKTETTARCSCGWSVANSDPVILQGEITKHYRGNVIPGGRSSNWPQTRAKLETAAEPKEEKSE